MRKYSFSIIALAFLAMPLTGCDEEDNPATQSFNLSPVQMSTIEMSNDFSFDIYRKLCNTEENDNISNVFSPMSVIYELGMLNTSLQGEGSEEILKALGLENNNTDYLHELCHALLWQASLMDQSITLWQANCLVTRQDVELYDAYIEDMNHYYGAEVQSLDFSKPMTIKFINDWCKEKTNGMIPKIVESLNPSTCMVLMNALYFNAPWKHDFKVENTKKLKFNKENGSSELEPFMCQSSEFAYGMNDTYATVRLPYGNNEKWNMYILLPNKGKKVKDIINQFTQDSWKSNVAKMSAIGDYTVNLRLPRFEIESDFDLTDALQSLGIKSMFSSETADFSKMTSHENMYISFIKQKSVIKVEEKGTEAAAVTYSGGDDANVNGVVDFYADHPFVYLIQEASSGAIFFIGTYHGE